MSPSHVPINGFTAGCLLLCTNAAGAHQNLLMILAWQDCGFRLWNQHEGYAYKSFPAINLDDFKHEPQAHVYCMDAKPEDLLRFKDDGLSKFSDQVSLSLLDVSACSL